LEEHQPIHERSITVKTFETGDNRIRMEGTLTDDRFCPSFLYSIMNFIEPGRIHCITVVMELTLPQLIIEKAEARMSTVPVAYCREVEGIVKQLVGLRMTRGFTNKIRDVLGGRKGCLHMNQLIMAMSAAAVQGSYAYYTRVREDGRIKSPEFDGSIILNSCHIWREGGPFASRLEEMKKAARNVRSPRHASP
jgi:hypothetical protein